MPSVECRSVPDISQRDPDQVAAILSRWLATKSADGSGPEVFDVQAPGSNGFSNETILCRTRSAGGDERRLVVRVAPTRHLLFLDAGFSTQYRAMRALADVGSAVPLPRSAGTRTTPSTSACPSSPWTTSRAGPLGQHPVHHGGLGIEATPEQQERMWWSGIDALAAVHRTDWRAAGLDWLEHAGPGPAGPRAADVLLPGLPRLGRQGRGVPVLESTWQWLVDHQPAEEGDVVISWGDSRIGNIIWDDFRCAAVLDWEMASLAQPEMDLGW